MTSLPPTPENTEKSKIKNKTEEYIAAFEILHGMEGWTHGNTKDGQLADFLARHKIAPERAEDTANGMASTLKHDPAKERWQYIARDGKSRYRSDLPATFRVWVKRPANNGARPTTPAGDGGGNGSILEARRRATAKFNDPARHEREGVPPRD